MSAVETFRRHSFGKEEDLGPPVVERAVYQLMLEEASKRVEAEKRLKALETALAEASSGRAISETKVAELTAELVKRSAAHREMMSSMEQKLEQAHESRSTANILSSQYKAEAEGERVKFSEINVIVKNLESRLAELQRPQEKAQLPIPAPEIKGLEATITSRDGNGAARTFALKVVR